MNRNMSQNGLKKGKQIFISLLHLTSKVAPVPESDEPQEVTVEGGLASPNDTEAASNQV